MKYFASLLIGCCFLFTAQAQPSISGYVYELQSGEPLEGVRVQFKNRQGLEIGTMQAIYTDGEGYYEFANVKPREYRAEITHVFDTSNGPTRLRIFTIRNIITIDSSDYQLNIALSRLEAERAATRETFAYRFVSKDGKTPNREVRREYYEEEMLKRFGPSWKKVVAKREAEHGIFQSRMIDSNGKFFYGASAEILTVNSSQLNDKATN
ncbi:MAG: carboxypeptidase regulatory-like domain-containing protein [Bacteroidota bacterium]